MGFRVSVISVIFSVLVSDVSVSEQEKSQHYILCDDL
jgi:hypothetical protein